MPRATSVNDPNFKPQIWIYSYATAAQKSMAGQFEFDVSQFRDPAGQKQFLGRDVCGIDAEVRDWVGQDRRVPALVKECRLLAEDLIRPKQTGITNGVPQEKAPCQWLSISFRDHHGKWIAPAIAELVANALSDDGFTITVYHSSVKKVEAIAK